MKWNPRPCGGLRTVAAPEADHIQRTAAGYISHPRWPSVLLFLTAQGEARARQQADENITIYFPIIITAYSQVGLD